MILYIILRNRAWIAIFIAKMVHHLIRLLKLGSGSTLPGRVALMLSPDLMKTLRKTIPETVIAITGTNGKTTTAGLLTKLLEADGHQVLHNHLGANMLSGIATALVCQSNKKGKLTDADVAVLEVDEASLRRVADHVPITHVVVTNLFRDQLDRYGELDTTAQLIREGIEKTNLNHPDTPEGKLFLNADDTAVMQLADAAKEVVTFGLDTSELPEAHADNALLQLVPCQFEHNEPAKQAPDVLLRLTEESPQGLQGQLHITGSETLTPVAVPIPGRFNGYNALAAMAVASALNVPAQSFTAALENHEQVFGRAESAVVNDRTVRTFLIKNPAGATEVFRWITQDPNARVLLALNDNDADGRDVSWIWDAAFELLSPLAKPNKPIYCTGVRRGDMANRLLYGGVPQNSIMVLEDLMTSIDIVTRDLAPTETLYVLPTYTALLKLSAAQRASA